MTRDNNGKTAYFGVALLAQLALHLGRAVLLDAISVYVATSVLLSYLYGILTLFLKLAVFLIPTVIYLKLSGVRIAELLAPIGEKKQENGSLRRRAIRFAAAASITLNAANLAGMATDGIYKAMGVTAPASALPEDWMLTVITFLSAVILAPLLEELLFRGVALNALLPLNNGAIALCGLLFALMHYSAYSLLYAFVAGCLIAFCTKKSNSLKMAVGLHFVNNLLTFVSLAIAVYIGEVASAVFGYLLMALTLPLVVFGIIMLIKERRAVAEKTDERIGYGGSTVSFGIVLYIVLSALICLMTR